MSLLPYQTTHLERLIGAFVHTGTVLDSSDTGTGKTYVACALASRMNLRPLIICPKSVICTWNRVSQKFNLNLYGISNYESMKNCKWFRGVNMPQNQTTSLVIKIDSTAPLSA